jgi:hypothetical protein
MSSIQGIKLVSDQSEALASFRGPLIRYHVVRSIDHRNAVVRRWTVFSNGKRSVLTKYLFGKWLWDELNHVESLIFWSLPEITKDVTIYVSLKSRNTFGIPKRLIRDRLKKGSEFFGFNFITRQHYLTLKGSVNFFFIEETVSLRPTIKFSGYTKHYKDKGSLRLEREENFSDVSDPYVGINELLLLEYLTVGEISHPHGRVIFS